MWPKCTRVLLGVRAGLIPRMRQWKSAFPLHPPMAFNSGCGNEVSSRYCCVILTYQGPRGKCAWNLILSGNQKYLSELKTKSKLKKTADVHNNFLGNDLSVGFNGAISNPFHYFLQRFSRDLSLRLPRYLKKYCVTKNHSHSGACTMRCPRKDKYGGVPNSRLESWIGRLGWRGNVAWAMTQRINNPSRRLTSRIALI